MKFIIPGEPIAQQRTRTSVRGGVPFFRNPNSKEKDSVKIQLMRQIQQFSEESANFRTKLYSLTQANKFHINVQFYQSIPDSLTTSQKNAKLWGFCDLPPSKRDLDNFLKFTLDCCNGILFSDDHLIVSLNSSKHYSNNPRTQIEIIPIMEKSMSDEEKLVLCQFDPEELLEFLQDAQNISSILNPICESYPKTDKEDKELLEWVSSKSSNVAKFATKYADKLKKIERKLVKTSGEGKTLC